MAMLAVYKNQTYSYHREMKEGGGGEDTFYKISIESEQHQADPFGYWSNALSLQTSSRDSEITYKNHYNFEMEHPRAPKRRIWLLAHSM